MKKIVFFCVVALVAACSGPSQSELDKIAEVLELQSGQRVADIGAGEGEYAMFFSGLVGEEGRVFATEIDAELIDALKRRLRSQVLNNIEVVQASATLSGLEARCCDVLFMRNVYHHLTNPKASLADYRKSMREGGRFFVIDFTPLLLLAPWTPEDLPENRDGHGVMPEWVVEEVEEAGFELVMQIDDWPGIGQFALLFESGPS